MNEEIKKSILQDLDVKIGSDIYNLFNAYDIENELVLRRNHLQSSLIVVSDQVPTKLSSAVKKAEKDTEKIQNIKQKSETLQNKVKEFLTKAEPLRKELDERFKAIHKLEAVLGYLKSYEKIEDLSRQLKQCNDDEQAVLLYGELKTLCAVYSQGHRSNCVREYTHYWHNILKEKFTKQYEDNLKALKWPFATSTEIAPPSKENLTKFNNLTKYLFLIEEPKNVNTVIVDGDIEQTPCLPVKILLKPLKKRFAFHFTGPRQTARIDRPEWFLTQTLTWIKDHSAFIKKNLQPIADKLQIKNVKAEDEFNTGLIALAAERLHTVLGLYRQGCQIESLDMDAAFAHAVDETLGFHKELSTITGKDGNSVISVLTKAETFVKWLSVEKKYALAKMDETLSSGHWMDAVAAGVGSAVGAVLWVPRGADWFISLLKTMEDRYVILPQPGHRLQFLELQLELVEEWRVRLTQLQRAAQAALGEDSFLRGAAPHALPAAVNAAHHTWAVLLQWAHSLHYLQLHYYRRQFQNFTQQHHEFEMPKTPEHVSSTKTEFIMVEEMDESVSLIEVETRANKLALNEISRRNSSLPPDIAAMIPLSLLLGSQEHLQPGESDAEESGVFAEAPALLLRLRDAGLDAISDHVLLEFKAAIKDYKKQKWYAMSVVEERALAVSAALCRPLAALCARLHAAGAALAPSLGAKLRSHLAADLDHCLFEEVVLENWWNSGGTAQLNHDVSRNLLPVFAPPNKNAGNQLPKLTESCLLLDLDYEDARRLRAEMIKKPHLAKEFLLNLNVKHITPADAVRILNQRTDINDMSPQSVMELF